MFSLRLADADADYEAPFREAAGDVCSSLAFSLAQKYREYLLKPDAPPHSTPFTIPHAYNGWKPGGFYWAGDADSLSDGGDLSDEAWLFGDVSGVAPRQPPPMLESHRNNTVAGGNIMGVPFAEDQTVSLANYIESEYSGDWEKGYYVGMSPSHVSGRDNNYLVLLDQGLIPGIAPRPWIEVIFDFERRELLAAALQPQDASPFGG
ncbi:MAG: hypothetical protein RIT02_2648 [Planctomycetota bacterium]|jgi:hypothetical protein